MNLSNLFFLTFLLSQLSLYSCNLYKRVEFIVNESEECSKEDVTFMDNLSDEFYWIWVNSMMKYLRIKLYLFKNETILNVLKEQQVDFSDSFFSYSNPDEFIQIANDILTNGKTLTVQIEQVVPPQRIKYFQELSFQDLKELFLTLKHNLIASYNKYERFELFRDVANSKYIHYKKMLMNDSKIKKDVHTTEPKIHEIHSSNNAQLKNVIIFKEDEIPVMEKVLYDYYDSNDYDKEQNIEEDQTNDPMVSTSVQTNPEIHEEIS